MSPSARSLRRPVHPADAILGRAGGPTLRADVVESKLKTPAVRRDSVSRTALVNRLRAAGAFPVVLVVAPAGYGKTSLLAQWAAKDARPFAWLSIDRRDNDPAVLLRHLAAALDRVDPIDPAADAALAAAEPRLWDVVVPRLTAQLAARPTPLVLVLDDVDLLEADEAISVVTAVIENIPAGSIVALSGRTQPKLPVAALRVEAPLLEIGPYELALSRREAELLLKGCAVELEEDALAELLDRTEGWPAALYLAALAAREDAAALAPHAGEPFSADDRFLADYFRSEYVDRLPPDFLQFLRRTSVLDKLCSELCDAVLDGDHSARFLAAAEDENLFFVPLDRRRRWYRYHQLFRDFLRRELEDEEPELVADLNRRAAAWYEAHGDPESALAHAYVGGDSDGAARLLSSIALDVHHAGRVATLERWLKRFDDDERLEQYPAVAVHGSRVHALRGRPEEAERWLGAAERGSVANKRGVAAVRPWIGVMRSAMCAYGPARMRLDAETARRKLPRGATWRPSALLVEGAAAILLGDGPKADSVLADAVAEAEHVGARETQIAALGERSLLAAERTDYLEAEELAREACRLIEENEFEDYSAGALALAASARAHLRHGAWDKARQELTLADELAPRLTYALPWLAVQVRLELGHAYVTLRDRDKADGLLDEARAILHVKPKLGVLATAVEELAQEIAAMPSPDSGRSSGLTAAELRLLPLLSTHLSFREIGQRLFVSRNTIKTQAISVYRKLGVSSRSEAIERAVELGLVEAGEQVASSAQSSSGLRPVF